MPSVSIRSPWCLRLVLALALSIDSSAWCSICWDSRTQKCTSKCIKLCCAGWQRSATAKTSSIKELYIPHSDSSKYSETKLKGTVRFAKLRLSKGVLGFRGGKAHYQSNY
ncbi:hypothetical protein ONS95_014756 [Cadophora gregata]|uniref:uncharacterized protein n=1 Tax=Cadophora gregata TaxID=51156 RepID=UPI0026DB54DC|nr:uncharacterized protein ONS95_014756 [Cadophora gregata]KAK0113050.1 hypothetical protein ONS95_014756 [Cadophora gregata]